MPLFVSMFAALLGARPGYHYTRPYGWMNDPVPLYDPDKQLFHLFHLCDPNSTKAPWAGGWQGWCHASSPDMATSWTTHPVALPIPAPGTGSAALLPAGSPARADLNARAAIMTSSAGPFSPQLWVSSDEQLLSWRKVGLVRLPVPPNISAGLATTGDVHLWRDEGRKLWRLLVSGISAKQDGPPIVLHYESSGGLLATDWRFTGILFAGTMTNRLECPSFASFYPANDTALLTYSWPTAPYAPYWVTGTEGATVGAFGPRRQARLEFGVGYAAGLTTTWPGRLLLFSWMRGVSDGTPATYVGAQSLPREMTVLSSGGVSSQPAAELEGLIRSPARDFTATVVPHAVVQLPQPVPQQARVRVRANASGTMLPATFGLTLRQVTQGRRGHATAAAAAAAAAAAPPPSLTLTINVLPRGACASLDPNGQGCAPLGAPIKREGSRISTAASPSGSASATWSLSVRADVWVDNGLIEAFVGDDETGLVVLSAWEPALFDPAAALVGNVWSGSNSTTDFALQWNEVASANFSTQL
jgi:sucrose-6-phosphate hydrolase SacC (GH32 family)